MNQQDLTASLRSLRSGFSQMSLDQRYEATRKLMQTTEFCIQQLRGDVIESDAATNRRKAKRRETEVDPKPPVKPVIIAEPSKPKKPTYKGR